LTETSSAHLSKLEGAGLIQIHKRFNGKKPQTLVSLTKEGIVAIERHWKQLERVREKARNWKLDQHKNKNIK
jgi:DNA-binding MarR family transcriptional regulator